MILVAAATPWESVPLARALRLPPVDGPAPRRWAGGDGRLLLVETGMGPAAAAAAVAVLGPPGPALVVSSGLAGSLSEEAAPGDIVADLSLAPPPLAGAARRLASELGLRLHEGPLASSDRVLAAPRDKRALGARTGAKAVDMESGALRAFARAQGAGFATVRAVFDGVDERLPQGLPGEASLAGSLSYALAHWREALLLARLGLRQRSSMAGLCSFLVRIFSEVRDEQTP